jgi:curved DNA-binding protein CbpA
MNPYFALGVPPSADDQTIRRAYLEELKQATPEANPTRFKILAAAYEQIKDEAGRNKYELFHTDVAGDSPLEAFLEHARNSAQPKPMPFDRLKEYLRICSKT